jgi:putative transcriptional regulator
LAVRPARARPPGRAPGGTGGVNEEAECVDAGNDAGGSGSAARPDDVAPAVGTVPVIPSHHPGEETLLAHAVGALSAGSSLAIRVHLETCAYCRSTMRFLDLVGAALIAAREHKPLRNQVAARARAALAAQRNDAREPAPRPSLIDGLELGPWRPMGPGLYSAAVGGVFAADETVSLLRGDAGAVIPPHSHTGIERFVVLEGGFGIEDTLYGPGDYIEAGVEVVHSPYVLADAECVCLSVLQGQVRFLPPHGQSARS